MRLAFLCGSIFLCAVGRPGAAPQTAAPAPISVPHLFESYARGDYSWFDEGPARIEKPGAFIADIKRDSKAWIQAAVDDPVAQARRRLIAATVGLEAAFRPGLRFANQAPMIDALGRARAIGPNENLRDLAEWGCSLVRQNRIPDPAERLWHWLAIALMQGDARYEPLEIHVRHALDRFPAEPRFVLARAIAAELRTAPDERDRSPRDRDRYATETLAARLEAAEQIGAVRDEARLRHGFLLLRISQPAAALAYIGDPAAIRDDPFLTHLGWLFRGRALEALDRLDDAIASYRAAAAALPHAQTAAIALASALARRGDRAEAARIGLSSLNAEPAVVDPWRMYGSADHRVWQRIRDALRAELRR